MSTATITDLSTRRPVPQPVEPPEQHGEWTLPPGAVPIDCVTFGQALRTIERLTKRLDDAERRLKLIEKKHADCEGNR